MAAACGLDAAGGGGASPTWAESVGKSGGRGDAEAARFPPPSPGTPGNRAVRGLPGHPGSHATPETSTFLVC